MYEEGCNCTSTTANTAESSNNTNTENAENITNIMMPTETNAISYVISTEMAAFMKENNIPNDAYDIKVLSRFIRINPKKPITIAELKQQLGTTPQPVPWFPSFYRLPRDVPISSTPAYKEAKIYGMDVSSGSVVRVLDCKPGHHILDLCCAPGTKLCMLGDEIDHTGSLTGVDVSKERLSTCKAVLRKYNTQNTRLFHTDGCSFSILAPGPPALDGLPPLTSSEESPQRPLKRQKKRRKGRENDVDDLYFCNAFPLRSANSSLYDRVLVDAECTLDASVRHILLYGKSSPNTTPQLSQLQKQLICNGFRLLKPGGILVYSTCSFCTAQNEEVVQTLFDTYSSAKALPVQMGYTTGGGNVVSNVPWDKGFLEHTVRFYPKFSGTSGMFIAKITKVM